MNKVVRTWGSNKGGNKENKNGQQGIKRKEKDMQALITRKENQSKKEKDQLL